MTQPEIIVVHETMAKGIVRDATSFATVFAMCGVGIFLESAAMQWVGGILALLVIFSQASRVSGKNNRMTIAQARARLDELEAEQ